MMIYQEKSKLPPSPKKNYIIGLEKAEVKKLTDSFPVGCRWLVRLFENFFSSSLKLFFTRISIMNRCTKGRRKKRRNLSFFFFCWWRRKRRKVSHTHKSCQSSLDTFFFLRWFLLCGSQQVTLVHITLGAEENDCFPTNMAWVSGCFFDETWKRSSQWENKGEAGPRNFF